MFKPANAVQIRVSIDEIQPEVWRRLVLPSAHRVRQVAALDGRVVYRSCERPWTRSAPAIDHSTSAG
ncbi:hypothetical protein BV900_26690 [Agrobacterium tumefaciens]|nr:hypothetical protein BV900_26690 [Agrobacterium tumefaciens]